MLSLIFGAAPADATVLEDRIDVYDPVSMAYRGSETTWYDVRGRRLRLEITDADGRPSLLFFVRHDERGRESEAIYFEGDSPKPTREVFTYSAGLKTTTYFYEPGIAAERTESVLDASGREIHKRYYRADGTQYGEEDVLWAEDGTQTGWDFRYVGRPDSASFRYEYVARDADGVWTHRYRYRDGVPERLEVRTRVPTSGPELSTSLIFAPRSVSTSSSETSPSFTADGETLVFARYDEDWERKSPFIARLAPDGWEVEPLGSLGTVYNLGISPDGGTIVFSRREGSGVALFRVVRTPDGWSDPEDLGEPYGISGAYPHLTANGDLAFFDADGPAGAGIYRAARTGDGFAVPVAVFTPDEGMPFDPFVDEDGRAMLVTRCFDDTCASGPRNGVWEIKLDAGRATTARKLPDLPYVWGAHVVPSMGLLVFTDGEEIRALPLRVARN